MQQRRGVGGFDEMQKSGDSLRYVNKGGGDFFKLPGGAIELWDGEGKWIEASPAPVCWKF